MTRGTLVVTGGGRGIGRGLVIEGARRGYDVVFTHRGRGSDAEETIAAATAAAPGAKVEGAIVDLLDHDQLRAFGRRMREAGPVKIFIHNAGSMQQGRLRDMTMEMWDDSFAVNSTAPMILAQELEPALAEAKGAILNVTSTGGVVGSLHGVGYGASKSAIVGLTKTLARELAPTIRVNAMAPGPVRTDMYNALPEDERRETEDNTPLGRVAEVEEITRVALDVCEWTYVTGQTIIVDGGRVL